MDFHFCPHFPPTLSPHFCCHYCYIKLAFLNNLADVQLIVLGTGGAKRTYLRGGAIRGEADLCGAIFAMGTICPLLLPCAPFHSSFLALRDLCL